MMATILVVQAKTFGIFFVENVFLLHLSITPRSGVQNLTNNCFFAAINYNFDHN